MIDVKIILEKIKRGDRVALGRALSILESSSSDYDSLIEALFDARTNTPIEVERIGITGSPGSGKSTLIDAMGIHYIEQGFKPGIITIDPSSHISKGSILGDKLRMARLTKTDRAFIRPYASKDKLDGLTHNIMETVLLMELGGYGPIIIETVGVGQSQLAIREVVDITMLVVSPSAGDDIQAIKRGIMEIADMIVMNKADGELEDMAKEGFQYLKSGLQYWTTDQDSSKPQVFLVSAKENINIGHCIASISDLFRKMKSEKILTEKRNMQFEKWYLELVNMKIQHIISTHHSIQNAVENYRQIMNAGQLNPNSAAKQCVSDIEKLFFRNDDDD